MTGAPRARAMPLTGLAVDHPAARSAVRLHDRLRERRVWMDRPGDLLEARLELLRDHELFDQVRRSRADDRRSKQLAVARIADDLDHAAPIAVDDRGADATVGEAP